MLPNNTLLQFNNLGITLFPLKELGYSIGIPNFFFLLAAIHIPTSQLCKLVFDYINFSFLT